MSALSLDKPLPALPPERQPPQLVAHAPNENDVATDVPLQDLEGYIDMLGYLRRDLPIKPDHSTGSKPGTPTRQPPKGSSPPPSSSPPSQQQEHEEQEEQRAVHGQQQEEEKKAVLDHHHHQHQTIVIAPPIREDEWLSSPSRSHSRQSTAFTSSYTTTSEDDTMLNRARSRSAASVRGAGGGGLHLHSASASRRTVTPMSSMGSDADLRGVESAGISHTTTNTYSSNKPCTPPQLQLQLAGPAPARIDEEEQQHPGSEPGTTRSDALDRTPVGRRSRERMGMGSGSRDKQPVITPGLEHDAMPARCWHCGRDPSGQDAGREEGEEEEEGGDDSPATVLEPGVSPRSGRSVGRGDDDMKEVVGRGVGAEAEKGQSFAQRAEETSFCGGFEEQEVEMEVEAEEQEEEQEEDVDMDMDMDMERNVTPEIGLRDDDAVEFSSPFTRPANPDPYLEEDSPSELHFPRHHISQEQLSWEPEAEADAWMYDGDIPPTSPLGDMDHAADEEQEEGDDALPPSEERPPPYQRAPNPDPYSSGNSQASCDGLGPGLGRSFWKNPEGVILVYQGVEMNGDELYYGSDINYLGSFYDDDEGSSGLGSHKNSTVDLHGAGSGLAVIPEGGSSDDMWDDEVFVARGAGAA